MGWGWAGAEQEPPPPPLDPGPAHFEALPIQGAWQEFPSSPGGGERGWGAGTGPSCWGKRHRSLFPPLMEVSGRGQDNLQFPGGWKGSCWEG